MSLGNLVLRLESLDDKAKPTPHPMSFIQRSERADGGALNQTVLKHCKEPCVPRTFVHKRFRGCVIKYPRAIRYSTLASALKEFCSSKLLEKKNPEKVRKILKDCFLNPKPLSFLGAKDSKGLLPVPVR